ncbi:hypothetical protein [uncultured Nostoc sp.]|uniref:hypothetical protein n=1 Tax=uncultured Nostoc sp. TaxID=340711 RepID=UPI0035CB6942
MNYPVIVVLQLIHILHRATGSRGHTGKTRLRGFQDLNFTLVRVGGLGGLAL